MVALVAGVLVWIPPVIDQVRHDPGNLTILYRYFSNPPETSIGYVTGLKVMLVQLNPWGNWLTGGWITTSGTPIPGALLLVVWAVLAAVVSRRDGRLLRLNLVIGAGVVLAAASAAQIFGLVWGYLVEWFWALTALTVLSVCWSVVLLLGPRLTAGTGEAAPPRARRGAGGHRRALAVQASGIEPTAYYFPRQEAVLSSQTLAQVDHGKRYLVLWEDPIGLGGTGFGLMLQLERNGVRNGAPPQFRAGCRTAASWSRASTTRCCTSSPAPSSWPGGRSPRPARWRASTCGPRPTAPRRTGSRPRSRRSSDVAAYRIWPRRCTTTSSRSP